MNPRVVCYVTGSQITTGADVAEQLFKGKFVSLFSHASALMSSYAF